MLSFNISYPDFVKFPYFPNETERGVWGWKEAQRQGDFLDSSMRDKKKFNISWLTELKWGRGVGSGSKNRQFHIVGKNRITEPRNSSVYLKKIRMKGGYLTFCYRNWKPWLYVIIGYLICWSSRLSIQTPKLIPKGVWCSF